MERQEPTESFGGPDGARELEAIVDQYQSSLLRYATRLVHDASAAQDVVQDTFIKMYRGWESGKKAASNMSAWLYRVTHNNAVDYIRKESRLRVLHENSAADVSPTIPPKQRQAVEKKEAMKMALEGLDKLDGSEKQIVLLRVEEGLSYKEISEITKRTPGNVGCILHHAMKKLARGLKEAGAI